jgi:hypothetical protein
MCSHPAHAEIDVIFKIDESGSMGPHIEAVKANVNTIFQALPGDSAVGLVGYGAGVSQNHHPVNGLPHIHTPLTTDSDIFLAALGELVTSGGFEPGYLAVTLSAQDQLYDPKISTIGSLDFRGKP